jgi:hypothetical protein
MLQARCAAASRAAEAAAAERDLLERKVARLEKGKETELKGEHVAGNLAASKLDISMCLFPIDGDDAILMPAVWFIKLSRH